MSEEKGISGYVKSVQHDHDNDAKELNVATHLYSYHVKYNESAPYIHRMAGLSNDTPFLTGDIGPYQQLMIRARAFIMGYLHNHPDRINRDCTIMDGTSWTDSKPSTLPVLAICSINILWRDDNPYVSVHIGRQETIVGATVTRIPIKGHDKVMMYKHNSSDSPEEAVSALFNAVDMVDTMSQEETYRSLYLDALLDCFVEAQEYPIAAAELMKDGRVWYVPRPGRHHHIIHSDEYQKEKKRFGNGLQGFLTNHGNFVNRYRAMYMAVINGQVIDSNGMSMVTTRHKVFERTSTMDTYSGIIQSEDNHPGGYLLCRTPLFSEDLW